MKKTLFVTFSILMLFVFTSCGQVDDTNGEDDYTIQTYSDEDITSKSSSYSAIGFVENNIGKNGSVSASKYSGIYTIDSVKAVSGKLSFNFESTITSGNLRIVIINDGNIIDDVEINKIDTIEYINPNGNYLIKIVGESAKFSINWTVQHLI